MNCSQQIRASLSLTNDIQVVGSGTLPSLFGVTELAQSAVGAVGAATASLMEACGLKQDRRVVVDKRLASLWFKRSIYPIGWEMAPVWDAVGGDYRTVDGWIKLQTNLPHHRRAACKVLGVEPERREVKAATRLWKKVELETAISEADGVSAAMHMREYWENHPQGGAVAKEPLISWSSENQTKMRDWQPTATRPLQGLRVLDLTRVLAGPVATRTLAGLGAQVLRIDPEEWDEQNVVPDITLGKRCARLDLRDTEDRGVFEGLLRKADVFVHGYRPGALEGLGYGHQQRKVIAPKLTEVTLNAYGWTGPWSARRGFDSLVQMSCGIADAGMNWANKQLPTPLPVQALDHATGYLMCAAVVRMLDQHARGNRTQNAKLSLARTAELLTDCIDDEDQARDSITDPCEDDYNKSVERTPWGDARRLNSPISIGDLSLRWSLPPCDLGTSEPEWQL